MKRYDKAFKEEAVRLSNEIGPKKAAEQLGVSWFTLQDWRKQRWWRWVYRERTRIWNYRKNCTWNQIGKRNQRVAPSQWNPQGCTRFFSQKTGRSKGMPALCLHSWKTESLDRQNWSRETLPHQHLTKSGYPISPKFLVQKASYMCLPYWIVSTVRSWDWPWTTTCTRNTVFRPLKTPVKQEMHVVWFFTATEAANYEPGMSRLPG